MDAQLEQTQVCTRPLKWVNSGIGYYWHQAPGFASHSAVCKELSVCVLTAGQRGDVWFWRKEGRTGLLCTQIEFHSTLSSQQSVYIKSVVGHSEGVYYLAFVRWVRHCRWFRASQVCVKAFHLLSSKLFLCQPHTIWYVGPTVRYVLNCKCSFHKKNKLYDLVVLNRYLYL